MKGPGVGEQVAIAVAGGPLLARVLDAGDGYVRLDLAKHRGGPKLRRDDEATLLFAGDGGIVQLKGALRRDGLVSSAVRFEFEASKERIQRRRHVRVDAEVPLLLRVSATGSVLKSSTVNVSGGGLEIVDVVGMPMNALVKIELHLPGEPKPVPMTGRIVRRARPNTKGVKIERMILSDQDRLVKFIFARQRLELRNRKIA